MRKVVLAAILLSGFVMAGAPMFGPYSCIVATGGRIDAGSYGAPCIADWDGDGLKDLVLGKYTDGKIMFYANSGSNSAPVFTTYSYIQSDGVDITLPYGETTGATNPQVVDFNNDGILDIVVGDRNGYVNYFRGTATGVLTTEPDITANGVTIDVGYNSAPVIVDWNEDGLLDLILGQENITIGSVRLYLNSGTPENHAFTTYSRIKSDLLNIKWFRCTPQVFDLNLDGKKDLICGENTAKLVYYENIGTNASPVFSGYEYLESNGVDIELYYGTRLWVDDWDEDGLPDLLVSDFYGLVYLYYNTYTGIEEEAGSELYSSSELNISGSPTNGYFSVNILLEADSDVKFRIYSADGRIVSESGTVQLNAGEHDYGFDISGEPSGIYFVQIDTGSITLSESVVLLP